VGNQITSLKRFEPVVVCQDRGSERGFLVDKVLVLNEQQSGIRRLFSRGAYALLRSLVPTQAAAGASWLMGNDVELLHFHYGVDASFFLPMKRRLRVPAIVSFYGYDVSSFPRRMAGAGNLYLKRIFGEMDLFLAMSHDMRRDLIGLGAPPEQTVVHYYGSDCSRFQYRGRSYEKRDPIRILSVGTLEKKKGQHHLIHALAGLVKEIPGFSFALTLVGDGPLRPEIERLVREYGISDAVSLLGHISYRDAALERVYREADVFVLYSTTQPDGDKEGIPGTIVEAMSSGLPVVSTIHAGIPEIIDDNREGLLVREGDYAGLKRAVLRLWEDQDLRCRLGQAAARRALETLSLPARTEALEQLYDRLLHPAKKSGKEEGQ
jgi:glycosyltransferase involved in cell wall biosynthesis